LGNGFMFANFLGGEDYSFLACDEADAGDEKLAGDNQGDEPDGKEPCAKEANKGDGDKKFVGERIEEATKVGFDFPESGEVSVKPIGEGGGDEEGESEPSGPSGDGGMGTGLEKNEEDKGGDDAGNGKPIGKSHRKRIKGKSWGRKDVWGFFTSLQIWEKGGK